MTPTNGYSPDPWKAIEEVFAHLRRIETTHVRGIRTTGEAMWAIMQVAAALPELLATYDEEVTR